MTVEPHTKSDEDLMLEVKNGNLVAFDTLILKHQKPLVNYFYRHTGNSEEANDLTQETFLRIHKSSPRYKNTAKFTTWIYHIARNIYLDYAKYKKRHPSTSLDAEPYEKTEKFADKSISIEDKLTKDDLANKVKEAVSKLPEIYREVIILCEYQGLKSKEISKIIHCPEGTVWSRLHKAYELLGISLKNIAG